MMQKYFLKEHCTYLYPAILASLLLLPGCAPTTATTSAEKSSAAQADAGIQQANNLLKQGKKREAAQAYFAAANRYPSPQKERVILQAAELTASLGDTALTQKYLGQVSTNQLDGENRGRFAYVTALLALQNKNANLALSSLPTNTANLSPVLRQKVQHVRQQALALGGSGVNVQAAMVPAAVNNIAVLLPQSGALGSVSKEIYQGMQAARTSLAPATTLQIYDVNPATAVAQYQQAVASGADMIVGPLDKESLAQLLAQPQLLTKPLLSLNYLTSSQVIPSALYQFGLLPEDEARQAAQFALSRGQRTAVVLAPASSWGDRVASAFRNAYQQGGGQIVTVQQYPDSPSQAYSQQVQMALGAAQGRASSIFLAASPSQARLMRPLLAAQAPNLPIYATSHVFSGRPDPAKDRSLDGIIYTEIPWVVENVGTGTILNAGQFPRMYALGIDSFLIAKNLPSIATNPSARVDGKTGDIRLAGNRQVQRSLVFATFDNGLPRALGN